VLRGFETQARLRIHGGVKQHDAVLVLKAAWNEASGIRRLEGKSSQPDILFPLLTISFYRVVI